MMPLPILLATVCSWHWELFFQNHSQELFPPIAASVFVRLACKQALHWGILWKVDAWEAHEQERKRRGGGEKGELATISHLFFWVIFVLHCVILNLQYLGPKVFKILHFLTHRILILIIWYHYGPSPGTTLVNVVQLRSKMTQPDFNIVLGGKGQYRCL